MVKIKRKQELTYKACFEEVCGVVPQDDWKPTEHLCPDRSWLCSLLGIKQNNKLDSKNEKQIMIYKKANDL